jgi:hypothetical protein
MQGYYGGLIVIIMYSAITEAEMESFELITQSNMDILTQASDNILVSVA